MSLASKLRKEYPGTYKGLSDEAVYSKLMERQGIEGMSPRRFAIEIGEREAPSGLDQIGRFLETSLGQGATLSWGDEAAGMVGGAMDAAGTMLQTGDLAKAYEDYKTGYAQVKDITDRRRTEFREDAPKTALAGEFAGAVALPIGAGGVAANAARAANATKALVPIGRGLAAPSQILRGAGAAAPKMGAIEGALSQGLARAPGVANAMNAALNPASVRGLMGLGATEGAIAGAGAGEGDRLRSGLIGAGAGMVGGGLGAAAPMVANAARRARAAPKAPRGPAGPMRQKMADAWRWGYTGAADKMWEYSQRDFAKLQEALGVSAGINQIFKGGLRFDPSVVMGGMGKILGAIFIKKRMEFVQRMTRSASVNVRKLGQMFEDFLRGGQFGDAAEAARKAAQEDPNVKQTWDEAVNEAKERVNNVDPDDFRRAAEDADWWPDDIDPDDVPPGARPPRPDDGSPPGGAPPPPPPPPGPDMPPSAAPGGGMATLTPDEILSPSLPPSAPGSPAAGYLDEVVATAPPRGPAGPAGLIGPGATPPARPMPPPAPPPGPARPMPPPAAAGLLEAGGAEDLMRPSEFERQLNQRGNLFEEGVPAGMLDGEVAAPARPVSDTLPKELNSRARAHIEEREAQLMDKVRAGGDPNEALDELTHFVQHLDRVAEALREGAGDLRGKYRRQQLARANKLSEIAEEAREAYLPPIAQLFRNGGIVPRALPPSSRPHNLPATPDLRQLRQAQDDWMNAADHAVQQGEGSAAIDRYEREVDLLEPMVDLAQNRRRRRGLPSQLTEDLDSVQQAARNARPAGRPPGGVLDIGPDGNPVMERQLSLGLPPVYENPLEDVPDVLTNVGYDDLAAQPNVTVLSTVEDGQVGPRGDIAPKMVLEVDGEKYMVKKANDGYDVNDARSEAAASYLANELLPGKVQNAQKAQTGDKVVIKMFPRGADYREAGFATNPEKRNEMFEKYFDDMVEHTIFDWLIGNTDAHSKNVWFFPGKGPRGIDKGATFDYRYGQDGIGDLFFRDPREIPSREFLHAWRDNEIGGDLRKSARAILSRIENMPMDVVEKAVELGDMDQVTRDVFLTRVRNARSQWEDLVDDLSDQREGAMPRQAGTPGMPPEQLSLGLMD